MFVSFMKINEIFLPYINYAAYKNVMNDISLSIKLLQTVQLL